MEKNFFAKFHGLGNDYICLDEDWIEFDLKPSNIKTICNVHYGIGSDGVLLKTHSSKADFGLKIFNPDGSEAEKSGNGLRIFAKFLFDYGYTGKKEFYIETPGGIVKAKIVELVNGRAKVITVDMGKAIFDTDKIPVYCEEKECIGKKITINGTELEINCVSVGNPHCVIITNHLDDNEIKKLGPLIENLEIFPNRTNVQFVNILSPETVEIRIWERGAGYTLASGSSSCAVASVLVKKGLTDKNLTVKMPGGILKIQIDSEFNIKMTGEVQEICSGHLSPELIEQFI